MSFDEVSNTIESIKKFSDKDIELFVNMAVEQGLTFDPDYLTFILMDIRKPKEIEE